MKLNGKDLPKRIFVLLLCAAMVTSVAGCKGDTEEGKVSNKPSSSEVTSDPNDDNSSEVDSLSDDDNNSNANNSESSSNSNVSNIVSSAISSLTTTLRRSDKPSKAGNDEKVVEKHTEQPFNETVTVNGHTYKLVWNDEFEGSSIDYTKWCYGNVNNSEDSRLLTLTQEDDSSIIGVRDGQLQLNARRYFDPNNSAAEFAVNKSLQTQSTMNFKYGYVEMYAKVPHRLGAFPAFWILGSPGLVNKQQEDYYIEIDIFENVGGTYIDTNIHKWYSVKNSTTVISSVYTVKDENTWLTDLSKLIRIPLSSDDFNTLPYEYHKYSMEWTPQYIKTYYDNTEICHLDITDSWDKNWTYPNGSNKDLGIPLDENLKNDMTGFHDYVFLLLQNFIRLTDTTNPEKTVSEYTELPFEYWIDYVRLYQDPTVKDSGLIYLDKNGSVVNYYK